MGEQIRAIVKPELLVWARTSAHFEPHVAAKKANVAVERLLEWETGDSSPTINQLRTLANIYERPLATFFLPEAPKQFDAMRNFRRLPGTVEAEYSPELALTVRRARFRREIAMELAEELELDVPRLVSTSGSLRQDPNRFADEARTLLQITLQEQYLWRDKYEALNSWTAAVERLGVLVFQTSGVDIREMRGFSIPESSTPSSWSTLKTLRAAGSLPSCMNLLTSLCTVVASAIRTRLGRPIARRSYAIMSRARCLCQRARF